MTKKYLMLILVIVGVALATWVVKQRSQVNESEPHSSVVEKQVTPHPETASVEVPAHYDQPPSLSGLGPTLSPDKFGGKTRDAYQATKEIPQTIAQMPCYCYCDRGMGHKSLHSCFEDDHAAHCDVCTNEALVAYRLQKQGLTPKQIREQIIAQFSEQ
jgi:hypothetical protein